MERRRSTPQPMTGVPLDSLRGRMQVRYSRWVEDKVAERASGDLCTRCGHDALYHQATNPRQQRKAGVARGLCHKCKHGADVGLRLPPKIVCPAFGTDL